MIVWFWWIEIVEIFKMEEIGIVLPEKVSRILRWNRKDSMCPQYFLYASCFFQDDQTTDVKGLAYIGPQTFDELEAEDLYTKYKVSTQSKYLSIRI